jgi:hypothetical protein
VAADAEGLCGASRCLMGHSAGVVVYVRKSDEDKYNIVAVKPKMR